MDDAWSDLSHQVSILCDGWSERIEWAVRVNDESEARVSRVTHAGLLEQLRSLTHSIIRAKQEGGSGSKPGSKPPGAFEAASLLDEIGRYAHDVRTEWRGTATRTLRSTVARELHYLCDGGSVQPEEAVREVSWHLRGYIRRARIITGHDVPTRAFADTVCGECGGELRAPIDNAGDVFCAGTPATGPCGTKYTSWDVITLAMDLEATNGSEAS